MKAGDDNQFRISESVDDGIRKLTGGHVTKLTINARMIERHSKCAGHSGIDSTGKLKAQSRRTILIPCLGIQSFTDCFWPKDQSHQRGP